MHFDGLRLRIGGETMLFRSVLLSSADAPGATVVFLIPSDAERFAALMARRSTP